MSVHAASFVFLHADVTCFAATIRFYTTQSFRFVRDDIPAISEAQRDVLDSSAATMKEKILSRQTVRAWRETVRSEGKRVVFTNGCFDLLHVGHVRYLQAARALGDALLVAINSDRSVRELKGAGRPVMNEEERAEVLAALGAVSAVVVFDEASPRGLIGEILPDVLVKGGDYGVAEIHGREEVEATGGRVLSLPFVEGASTTSIIERIRNSQDRQDNNMQDGQD